MSTSPFDALGLPARPDLTDEQVRAAWRAIATATHPDRADGGDVARYTAATAAYVTLRTPWGRSEAYADVAAAADDTSPLPSCRGAAWPTRPRCLMSRSSGRGSWSPRTPGSCRPGSGTAGRCGCSSGASWRRWRAWACWP